MTWNDVDTYLRDIADLIHESRGNLRLFREAGISPAVEITAQNVDNGYLKPDVGFGVKLNTYFVQIIQAHRGQTVTSWSLYEFPSCCAFCVSTQARVVNPYMNKGVNARSNVFRQDLARSADYTVLICTDVVDNEAERKTLVKNGFRDIYQVRNKRTGNDVAISVKEL